MTISGSTTNFSIIHKNWQNIANNRKPSCYHGRNCLVRSTHLKFRGLHALNVVL